MKTTTGNGMFLYLDTNMIVVMIFTDFSFLQHELKCFTSLSRHFNHVQGVCDRKELRDKSTDSKKMSKIM